MNQLQLLRELLGNPQNSDEFLQFYLDTAKTIICELRNTNEVEPKFSNIQVKMAIEMYNKIGAEGQVSHSENGIGRSWESADVSPSLLSQITPKLKTPFTIRK